MPAATDASRAMRRSMAMEPSTAPRLPPGTMVAGRYRILDVLGEGGMGTVYRAEQPALHRRVALKVVRPELSTDASMIARFEREAYASSRISSPHVVVVHDFGRDESGLLYLIMELLEGESLEVRMEREGALSVGESVRICRDVARALEVAHAAGIVHRDLKPDNVFLTTQGDVKVLDFGIARIAEGPGGTTAGNATMTGMIVGTPVYMSPEAITRAPVGPATDLYALGVMLYELLAGQPPFMANEAVVLMSQHLQAAPPPITKHVPSLAKKRDVVDLVSRLLAKEADKRGDTKAASAALTKLAKQYADTSQNELAQPRVSSAPMSVPPPRSRAGVLVAVGLACALLALIGAGAIVWINQPSAVAAVEPVTQLPVAVPPVVPPVVLPPVTVPVVVPVEPTTQPLVEQRVTVSLVGLPEGATIESADGTVDGPRVTFVRDTGMHAITVRAEGFNPLALELDSASNASRTVTLERRRGGRRTGPSGGATAGEPPTTSESTGGDPGGLRREF